MSLNPSSNNRPTNGLTLDLRSLDRLKATSGKDAQAGIKETARQLEGLFMQELVKSMRSTTMNSGMMDNSATEMGTNMLDSQLANQMTGLPGGLSDLITKQLERQLGITSKDGRGSPLKGFGDMSMSRMSDYQTDSTNATASSGTAGALQDDKRLSASERFVRKHKSAAQAAEQATGIPASNILGQAALESGWGKHEIRMKDGTPSHNLFGIKATSNWTGKVAEVTTTEYIGGVARKVTAKFRAYDSYEEAFKDHAKLLSQSPRYSQTVAQADTAKGFAHGLQKAGYATDPAYADKLTKVINTTLRLQKTVT
ncbi:MAG TPA: flagellar assembly peptidoglycan hydrolase FlgJ [Aquabacterium sp.]|uniref:flagellar assembly peptidoglycan hydrolase FlgJ n=1 Tax=Aquabacterium sp. TaxID=1872578 RepID=UPI002E335835|nr:flagellar assembly peptidoglycan hydrolase FlgJ [Aquabacterium sp.]HEX5356656.1 flagellar assembly peptidoglycan hydrolase FlgJ [Aquabacterium sp.]